MFVMVHSVQTNVVIYVLASRLDNVYIRPRTHHESSPKELVSLNLSCGIFIKNKTQSQNKADLGSTKSLARSLVKIRDI